MVMEPGNPMEQSIVFLSEESDLCQKCFNEIIFLVIEFASRDKRINFCYSSLITGVTTYNSKRFYSFKGEVYENDKCI